MLVLPALRTGDIKMRSSLQNLEQRFVAAGFESVPFVNRENHGGFDSAASNDLRAIGLREINKFTEFCFGLLKLPCAHDGVS